MIDRGKKNLLGVLIDAVDYDGAVDRIISAAQDRKPFTASALAVHGVMTGVTDSAHRYRLNRLDLVTPDGQPVRWALNLLHKTQLSDRVYGPTLTLKVCAQAVRERLPVYFYGSQEEVLKRLVENVSNSFPGLKIAGTHPSYFRQLTQVEEVAIANEILDSGAAIVFVGLGCPRQEVWVYEHRDLLSMPLLAVGAAFDFHAGTVSQAPRRLQNLGLEWFYRFLHEPRRLWKRYLYLNPLFLSFVALQLGGLHDFDPANVDVPDQEMRFG